MHVGPYNSSLEVFAALIHQYSLKQSSKTRLRNEAICLSLFTAELEQQQCHSTSFKMTSPPAPRPRLQMQPYPKRGGRAEGFPSPRQGRDGEEGD